MTEGNDRDGEDVAAPPARPLLWADSPRRVEWVIRGLMALCALLVVFELFWHRHAYVPGESMFGYHAIVGFFAFMWIVLGAKGLRRLIRREEGYYGDGSIDGERYPEGGLARRDARETGERLLLVRDGEVVGEAGEGGPRPTTGTDRIDADGDRSAGAGGGRRRAGGDDGDPDAEGGASTSRPPTPRDGEGGR